VLSLLPQIYNQNNYIIKNGVIELVKNDNLANFEDYDFAKNE
jgi:hypothetical protein